MSGSRNLNLTAAGGTAVVVGGEVALMVTSHFEIKWFQIAIEHERAALEARDRADAARDDTEWGVAFDDELKAAMVAIAASAFAIDAMHRTLDDMLAPTDRSRAKGEGRIVETFKIALELDKGGQEWQSSIHALFKQRGALVHFRGKPHETVMHPTGKFNVSRETATYTAEATTRDVDLALEVLTTAYRSPRSKHAAIVEWAKSAAHVPAYLESVRHAR
jgi:hypothetical protein